MSIDLRRWFAGSVLIGVLVYGAPAQQPVSIPPAAPAQMPASGVTSRRLVLDVVVTPKSGPPVAGLAEKDFQVLDNGAVQTLQGFRAMGKDFPVEVILLVDAVNTGTQSVAYERQEIERFLHGHGGQLAQPTTLAVLTDTGVKLEPEFTKDGNALSASLERYTIGLRDIRRSAGFYGAEERLQVSLKAMSQLLAFEETRPGRKVILWVSPGWPLLSGPNTELSSKQQAGIFGDVVRFSDGLRRSRTTLYSIDPLGMADAGTLRILYFQEFLKGATQPRDVQLGNLGLQVLAVQSGGLALNSSNDVANLLERCMADTQAFYEMSFVGRPAERANEYHRLEVKVEDRGLTARTRQGYYSQP